MDVATTTAAEQTAGGVSLFVLGSVVSLIAGSGSVLGAVPVFFLRRPAPAWEDALLGAAAGVMLAA
ncbi:MAG: hypothetical protein D6826_08250, partial [Alphaproteobacteria bacterium]